ncbi:potassium efflux system protein [Moraxella macacae 0408225]|uniref:Potassium efflux system protein n=1 Tax=Moraxella macacae 0408225 TaxID=1230338 RepID=L2F6P6_9GAMM|nr:monovalent cation:proton antiporter-2 (CPA2) family protein [Moraxella macacae]ELA08108.1 potassium efflux system protein [Moraxella macacae 0408225]
MLLVSLTDNLMLKATLFLGVAVIFIPLLKRFGIATVMGYLLLGLMLGPSGFAVENDATTLLHFSEFGVVLLLFIIGLELQPSRLWALRHAIFVLGGLQVLLTGLALMMLVWQIFGLGLSTSFVIGFGLSLSSTAFVLQLLTEKQQLSSTHGQQAFTILLFQDIAVIPLLAMLPFLSGVQAQTYDWVYFAKIGGVFAGLILASRYVVRPFFKFIDASGANELLTAVALFIVFGVSVLMESIGLSMALGAFLTGVLLADSEYRHELEASIEPFKGLLLGLFFMSVGMLTDVKLLIAQPLFIIGSAIGLMLVKFFILSVLAKFLKKTTANSTRLGLTLAQGGEFAFVLFSEAYAQNLLTTPHHTALNLIVTISMALTPFAFLLLEKILEPKFAKQLPIREFDQIPNNNHRVIIAGFGRFGQIVGRVLSMHNIEFTAIEKSAHRVDFVRKFGNQVYYGNPQNPEILRTSGIGKAKLFVIAFDDLELALSTAQYILRQYPHITILARATDRQYYYRLREIGVQYIWRETFLSSLDMAKTSLNILGFSDAQASNSIETFRKYDEELLACQQAIYDNEAKLIESALSASRELERLFDSDVDEAQKEQH